MRSKLSSLILVFVFMSFIITPTVVYAFNLNLDTSVCFQISEEEQESISKVDIKQLLKESNTYFSIEGETLSSGSLFYKELNVKLIPITTCSPPPEAIL
jgi:hypothetical protein